MLTIGDVAHRTGVSRRMLRHWEAEGLLEPAAIDPASGYRRYTPAQAGRVHAIAALRAGVLDVAPLQSYFATSF